MTSAPRSFVQALAAQLGVSEQQARTVIRQNGGMTPQSTEADAAFRAESAMADLDAAASIEAIDIHDAAQDPDPLGSLDEMLMTRSERSMRSRLGAHASWAQTEDRTARTRNGRAAFEARFEREVDPEGKLDPHERRIRAEHARKAYFARLSLKSAQARRRKRAE